MTRFSPILTVTMLSVARPSRRPSQNPGAEVRGVSQACGGLAVRGWGLTGGDVAGALAAAAFLLGEGDDPAAHAYAQRQL